MLSFRFLLNLLMEHLGRQFDLWARNSRERSIVKLKMYTVCVCVCVGGGGVYISKYMALKNIFVYMYT